MKRRPFYRSVPWRLFALGQMTWARHYARPTQRSGASQSQDPDRHWARRRQESAPPAAGRAIGAVLDGDTEADQLVPKRIGPGRVPLGSGLVALGDQGLDLVVVDGHVGPIALTGADGLLLKASGRFYRPVTTGGPAKIAMPTSCAPPS